jgi:putative SOS response-associated peptidase YedK
MCGRYSLHTPEQITTKYGIKKVNVSISPHYNIAPGSSNPVILRQSPLSVKLMRWGLIPSYAKDINLGYRLINARSETIDTKPTFRRLLSQNRCIIPANGYFEWQKHEGGKIPYYFHAPDSDLLSFAGLFDTWKDAEGVEIQSYTILTRQANKQVDSIHHRMPVIVLDNQIEKWLDHKQHKPEAALKILADKVSVDVDYQPVSTAVNSASNDEPEVIKPV